MTAFTIVKRRVCCFLASRISRSRSVSGTSCSTVLIILRETFASRRELQQSCFGSCNALTLLQPADQQLALVDHFRRQPIVQIQKQLFLAKNFLSPGAVIEGLQLLNPLLRKIEPGPFEILVSWRPANRSFLAERTAVRAIHYPLQ